MLYGKRPWLVYTFFKLANVTYCLWFIMQLYTYIWDTLVSFHLFARVRDLTLHFLTETKV